jgi:peptide deformylase
VLREKCIPIDVFNEEVLELIQDLKDTCKVHKAHGLAAPQIGVTRRVFVTHTSGAEPMVFVNPEILNPEDPGTEMREGCLSFPGVEESVKRYGDLSIKALDEDGEEFTFSLVGLEAVAVQHENDHLDGRLLIDRVSSLKRRFLIKKVRKLTKPLPTQKAESAKHSKAAEARKERKRQRKHRKRA